MSGSPVTVRIPENMRFVLAVVSVALLIAAGAPAALAADKNPIPPGNSGAGQYVENIPGGGGNNPGGGAPSGGGGGHGGAVPSGTERTLNSSGPAGRATAALA